jgi:hypothetical protein
MIKIGSKNSLYPHKHFTEHLVAHIQKITMEERFEPRTLELFDLVAHELYRLLPARIHTQTKG